MSRWRPVAMTLVVAFVVAAFGALVGLTPLACAQDVGDREAEFARARNRLLDVLRGQGISDERVLDAMRRVPRHEFIEPRFLNEAYGNYPLPIGHEQTISQPYIVALMTQLLELEPGARVLEIGTGSGYQAAVLAEMGCEVYSVEIVPELAERASETLERLQLGGIQQLVGDGYRGWPEHAPFDAVIVTAAPPSIPPDLVDQLAFGGRMVLPLGERDGVQMLTVVSKDADGQVSSREVAPVRFVPMVKQQRH